MTHEDKWDWIDEKKYIENPWILAIFDGFQHFVIFLELLIIFLNQKLVNFYQNQ